MGHGPKCLAALVAQFRVNRRIIKISEGRASVAGRSRWTNRALFQRWLDPLLNRIQALFVNRTLRSAASCMLAVLLLTSALVAQNAVLCLGPGNHCHLETIAGCGDVSISHGSAPRPQDGCPKGSKDIRLGVDTHRTDNTRVTAASSVLLGTGSGLLEVPITSHLGRFFSRFPTLLELQHSTIVLRC